MKTSQGMLSQEEVASAAAYAAVLVHAALASLRVQNAASAITTT
jgi:NAD(P)H-hydrate repair Nnr-like enzyme with NAD(P)H-hydrate dehydratase domain